MALAVPEIDYYDDPAAFWWRPLQIWALVRTGELGEAEAVLAAFESRAADRGEPLALINAAWLRGSLAMAHGELDQAEQVLREGCRGLRRRALRLPSRAAGPGARPVPGPAAAA